ncbi:hypothetical protein [Deinococcus arcticus]|uniref:DoxX family protein n=1 Tax=Deinococcus arcticus TaxID=2136176 RepID=A0A2T3WD64_9DEIO|nr:hypothetical protein [Deinococcus arcticus]PTA69839.1 hypothetical protein C8263_02205 [Deinococcus arcticus]
MITAPLPAAHPEVPVHDQPWPWWRRFTLQFGSLYLALYFLVGVQGFAPLPDPLRFALADALSRALFQAPLPPPAGPTGSGDTALDWAWTLALLLVSLLGGAVWTVLDRRPPRPRLTLTLSQVLRVALIWWLAIYGLSKFNFGQFGLLGSGQLDTPYGESSPMGLLWRFMGASPGYQWLAGVAEVLPALLLLHRRTVTLGALVAAVTMTNVLALNLFYDVPVKNFSAHLLLSALVLLALDARRLRALVTGGAVPAQERRPQPRVMTALAWLATAALLGAAALQARTGLAALHTDRQRTQVSAEPLKTRGFHWVNETPYNR